MTQSPFEDRPRMAEPLKESNSVRPLQLISNDKTESATRLSPSFYEPSVFRVRDAHSRASPREDRARREIEGSVTRLAKDR